MCLASKKNNVAVYEDTKREHEMSVAKGTGQLDDVTWQFIPMDANAATVAAVRVPIVFSAFRIRNKQYSIQVVGNCDFVTQLFLRPQSTV